MSNKLRLSYDDKTFLLNFVDQSKDKDEVTCVYQLTGTFQTTIISLLLDDSSNLPYNNLIMRPIRQVHKDLYVLKEGGLKEIG